MEVTVFFFPTQCSYWLVKKNVSFTRLCKYMTAIQSKAIKQASCLSDMLVLYLCVFRHVILHKQDMWETKWESTPRSGSRVEWVFVLWWAPTLTACFLYAYVAVWFVHHQTHRSPSKLEQLLLPHFLFCRLSLKMALSIPLFMPRLMWSSADRMSLGDYFIQRQQKGERKTGLKSLP